jgi:hypothetical protein
MPAVLVLTPSIGRGPVVISSTYTPGARYSGIVVLLPHEKWNVGTTTVAPLLTLVLESLAVAPSGANAVTVTGVMLPGGN